MLTQTTELTPTLQDYTCMQGGAAYRRVWCLLLQDALEVPPPLGQVERLLPGVVGWYIPLRAWLQALLPLDSIRHPNELQLQGLTSLS